MAIYMDHAATTKIDSRVLSAVANSFSDFGNPSSLHALGREALEIVESARKKIATTINAEPEEIVFTSGGTESNNFALRGLARANPNKKHIIVSAIEHPSILCVCESMEKEGYAVDYIGVNSEGIVDPSDIEKNIRNDTLVVSIMHANNEIGSMQPISQIGAICKRKEVYFHTDAVQTFLKEPIDVSNMHIDLLTVSGHKVYAPKGIGFLYVKLGTRIKAILEGGCHEFKLRSGTENIQGIIALASATSVDMKKEAVTEICNFMRSAFQEMNGVRVNSSQDGRLYSILNVSFSGIDGSTLAQHLSREGICVSTKSASSERTLQESHVLQAIGLPTEYLSSAIRISLGKDNTLAEAKEVVESIKRNVRRLREMSP